MLYFLIALSYCMGSIPSGLWIGEYFHNIDIRQYGSGNTGTTNAYRILGKKSGSVVLIIDILKGTIPTLLALYLVPEHSPLLVGVAAIVGHTFSIFVNFKGGKAVATTAGVLLAVYPMLFIIGIVLFLACLYVTRMVSLTSMLVAFVVTVLSYVLYSDWIITLSLLALTLFIVYRHRSNIERIKNGTENKVPFGLGYKK